MDESYGINDLALLLYDIAKGSDSFIWNGHSTIASDSQFIVWTPMPCRKPQTI